MRHLPFVVRALAACMTLWFAGTGVLAAPTFEVMGNFSPAGVSDDGAVVAGTGGDPARPGLVMVRWTPAGGVQTAGYVPESEHTFANGISGDGSTILGHDYNSDLLYWTQAGGIVYPLASNNPGTRGSAGGISGDGSVITGGFFADGGALRWTAASGAVALPAPAGWGYGTGNAITADGSMIAGTVFGERGNRRAFRWTAADGSMLLDLPANLTGSDATAVSADGSTVVGWAYDARDVQHSFRWTAAAGLQTLGHLPGFPTEPALSHTSRPAAVTGDGSIVVGSEGFSSLAVDLRAFIWDATHGMRNLKSVLEDDYGLDLTGWRLHSVEDITPNGLTLVGTGTHEQYGGNLAWRVVLPDPAAGMVLLALCGMFLWRRAPRRPGPTPSLLCALGMTALLAPARLSHAADASFEVLGRFWPAGVSDDGNTIAGTWIDPALQRGQVMSIWTPAGGLRTAGFAQGSEHTNAKRISGDGSTILGADYNSDALYWTAASGIVYPLASEPPGLRGYPGDVSRDGSVITGHLFAAGPFRWTAATGAVELPMAAGWIDGWANAVTPDGAVIAGTLFNSPGHRRAFRWTAAGGSVLLDQPAGVVGSDATAVSADASTIVGWAYEGNDVHRPFRWTAESGLQLLNLAPGEASDVTADGSIIIGNGSESGGAFIWDAARGARDLKAALTADYGVDLTGWTIHSADAITPDGMTIVGRGAHAQFGDNVAWRVVVPEPGGAVVLLALCGALSLRPRKRPPSGAANRGRA